MEQNQNRVWRAHDLALCEYINQEFAIGRILRINEQNQTARVLLFIPGKKLKRITTDETTLSLSQLSVPTAALDVFDNQEQTEIASEDAAHEDTQNI